LILVLLGTHELPMTRLIDQVKQAIESGVITERVVVQAGHTEFEKHDNMDVYKFISFEKMQALYEEANLIITHGGTGSIISGLKIGKKVIAMPRLSKYNEHNDDHQKEIVEAFSTNGHILKCYEEDQLSEVIKLSEEFIPKPFKSKRDQMINVIESFIEEL